METRATLYTGGDVHTVDAKRPRAEAVAVFDGRILTVGGEDECRRALAALLGSEWGGRTETVDLGGNCLVPGFIDTHLHPVLMVFFEHNANLAGVRSIVELQERLRQAAGTTPANEWVVGLRLEAASLAEARLPTRHDLDRVDDTRPVMVVEHDGHTVVGNTIALRNANITDATPDPPGGAIDRESGGHPAGPCRESASQRLMDAMPVPDLERFTDAAGRCFERLASRGITSVGAVLQTDEEGPGGAPAQHESLAMQLLIDRAPFSVYSIGCRSHIDVVTDRNRSD